MKIVKIFVNLNILFFIISLILHNIYLTIMTKLILIRHGQSVWNAENRFTGWVDVDLSEKGVLEAEKSGQLLKI